MRKIICTNNVQQENEKFSAQLKTAIANAKTAFFVDPEDGNWQIEDPLSAFEKTDTYKSMSEEFKSQLKALLGYEYENRQDAENGLESLIRCFESQKETDLEIKASRAEEEFKVFINDNRKDRKIPNTYKGVLRFRISEKISIKFSCILSTIFAAISALIVVGIIVQNFGKLDKTIIRAYTVMSFSVIIGFKIFLSSKFAKKRKKLYSFEDWFLIGIMLTTLFLGYLLVHQNTNEVLSKMLKCVPAIFTFFPVKMFFEKLIKKIG